MSQRLKQEVTSKEVQKGGRQKLGWNGTRFANSKEGSLRKGWHKGSRTWTTQDGMLMIKGGCERWRVSSRNQMSMTKKKNDGDNWWFRDQYLMKKPRTLGKEEKENQEGRWPEPFQIHYHQEGIRHILRKETSHERSTLEPQSFEMSFLRPWERIRNLDLGEAFGLTQKGSPIKGS